MPTTTTREEVKRMLEAQMTPRQIAGALGLSVQGVHYHKKRLAEAGELAKGGQGDGHRTQ